MRNPLRSEADAYRFVLLSVGYFGAIVVATLAGGRWAGLGVFVLLTLVAGLWILRGRREGPLQRTAVRRGGADERRILVVANETVGGRVLREAIKERSAGYRELVYVVAPALTSPLRYWASDEDAARARAQERLQESLVQLNGSDIEARGEVGDADPLQAIEDGMRLFGPDEIIISTHPEGRSRWLERGVVEAARERFALPITHVVVDLDAEREEVR